MHGLGQERGVSSHYAPFDVEATLEAIRGGLGRAGRRLDALTPDDLAAVDQFHTRGKAATVELARLAGLRAGDRVLDVGGGVGGPARTLAVEFGCDVTVLDLTEAYCRIGEELTAWLELSGRVGFRHGSAFEMPFEAASFDVAWTQHSSMNMPDKERLYAEIERVVRPGGLLAMHEVLAGPVEPIHYPVPWAPDPSISFVSQPHELRDLLQRHGFAERTWIDTRLEVLPWFRERAEAAASGSTPPLGLGLLLGQKFGPAIQTMLRNLEEHRLTVVEAVFAR